MNVFHLEHDLVAEAKMPGGYLSWPDPVASAASLCDVHLNSQIKEAAQILCTAAHCAGYTDAPYQRTYENHVVVKWAKHSLSAWNYVLAHARAIHEQQMLRLGKPHRSWIAVVYCSRIADSDLYPREASSATGMSEPVPDDGGARPYGMNRDNAIWPWAMGVPRDLQVPEDPVGSYRAYYARKELSWAYNARRIRAGLLMVGRLPCENGLTVHSRMEWSSPSVRPVWMPEPPSRELTDEEAASLKRFLPKQINKPPKEYIDEHHRQIDQLLGTPEFCQLATLRGGQKYSPFKAQPGGPKGPGATELVDFDG